MPPEFRFCGACGARVEVSVEREVRKLVSVLFSDVSGSTTLGERLDPEALRHVMRRYFEEIERVIVAHGGLVEKFVGDAVMAVFGLPAAHEDDALRAVRAAAEIHEGLPQLAEETGLALAFCTGVNSGEVVAGSGQTLATGDAVNVAARLQQAAAPGEILLGAETVRLLGASVEAELLPPIAVHGKAAAVEAYRLRRLVAAEMRRAALFVDRERELVLLREALRRTVEAEELHLFTLLGPAGIGKSRLAAEFVASVADEARIASGRCLSYGQALSYWPLVELMRTLGDVAAPALERLVAGGATSPQELAWTVQTTLEQAASQQPLLVVLEDLHWAEAALLDLLDLVADLSRGAPILLLCLARPELLEQRPTWGGGKLNAASLLLEPLPEAECERLLAGLAPRLEPTERQRVVETAAGNPLFLEELLEFVAEAGAGELPPRIQALLQARLDRLPEPERAVLGCAAVEGTVFHAAGLRTLVAGQLEPELSQRLASLTRKELIRPARGELDGTDAFQFRHQLIRETLYAAIPKGERARLHERFAGWLEPQRDERPEVDEIVAYHLEQAALAHRDLGSGDQTLDARAASALDAAAGRARARTDLRAAADLWQRALSLFDPDDDRVPELEIELARVLSPLGEPDRALQLLDHAEQQTDDPCVGAFARLTRLIVRDTYDPEGTPAEIRRECARAIPLFEQRGDHRLLAEAWDVYALAEWHECQAQATADAWEKAAEHWQLAGDRAREAHLRGWRLGVLSMARMPAAAALHELEELETRFPGEPAIRRNTAFCRARAALDAGDFDEARRYAREAAEVMRRAGYPLNAAMTKVELGAEIEMLAGDLDAAERLAADGIAGLEEHGERGYLSSAKAILAEIRLLQGRPQDALRLADEAEELGGPEDRTTTILANAARARALATLGSIAEARAAAANAVAVAESTDALRFQAHAQYALAETLAAAEEPAGALAAANAAEQLYTAQGVSPYARRAAELTARIHDPEQPRSIPTER